MPVDMKNIVMPVTGEARDRENLLVAQLRAAEEYTVIDLLANDESPEQLKAALNNACGLAEDMTNKIRHPDSPQVACKNGCSWCCYQQVRVSVPEIFRIVDYLRNTLSETELRATNTRLRALDKQSRNITPKRRAKVSDACAFLKDDKCSIYPVRPISCAEFTSYDVKACKRFKRVGFKAGKVIHEKARLIAYGSIHEGFNAGIRKLFAKTDTNWLELTADVVDSIENKDAENAWAEGAPLFARTHLKVNTK